ADGWTGLDFEASDWKPAVVLPLAGRTYPGVDLSATVLGTTAVGEQVRAVLAFDDPLLTALGRTGRQQVVTRRDSIATTLQALELPDGGTVDEKLAAGARRWTARFGTQPGVLVRQVFHAALGRDPNPDEAATAADLVGDPVFKEGVQDLLWTIVMLPEFQLIY